MGFCSHAHSCFNISPGNTHVYAKRVEGRLLQVFQYSIFQKGILILFVALSIMMLD